MYSFLVIKSCVKCGSLDIAFVCPPPPPPMYPDQYDWLGCPCGRVHHRSLRHVLDVAQLPRRPGALLEVRCWLRGGGWTRHLRCGLPTWDAGPPDDEPDSVGGAAGCLGARLCVTVSAPCRCPVWSCARNLLVTLCQVHVSCCIFRKCFFFGGGWGGGGGGGLLS